MDNYNKAADRAEKSLNQISSSMCFAKWAQVSMHLTNGMTQSCYHPPLHKINVNDLDNNPSALHNTDQKKYERKLMLQGERPEGCSYCWRIEDAGARSDRIYRSGEYWAQNAQEDILKNLDTGNIIPRYVEVNFNQACNFKCMYCSPHLSTSWEDEVKKFGAFKFYDTTGIIQEHNNIDFLKRDGFMPLKVKGNDNAYVQAFWQWWPDLYKKLEVFRMTGGEPLMDANTFKVLDYIYQHPNAWLEVSVTSNLCPPKNELLDKFIDKVKLLEKIQIWEDKERFNPNSGNNWYVSMALKNFSLFVSIDSVGKQAEYIRYGLDFQKMNRNLEKFLSATTNTTVTFINTFNALSVTKFTDFLKWVLELRKQYSKDKQGIKYIKIEDPNFDHPDHVIHPRQRIWFDVPLLRNPEWQSISILPDEFQFYIEDAIEFMESNTDTENFVGFYDFEIAKVKRNLELMRSRDWDENKLSIMRHNFVLFNRQLDTRRNTNFSKIFPEFKKFLAEHE
jgi:hypothetical protein